MNIFPKAAGLIALVIATSCQVAPKYTQAQINAIETRDVEASMSDTYTAASSALFDAGYTISMSDRQGGLLTGKRSVDKSAERMWISYTIQDEHFAVSIQIRETSESECAARIKTSKNGQAFVDKEAIDQIWVLMQRQVMMKTPVNDSKTSEDG